VVLEDIRTGGTVPKAGKLRFPGLAVALSLIEPASNLVKTGEVGQEDAHLTSSPSEVELDTKEA
jgi:hypothetical protein